MNHDIAHCDNQDCPKKDSCYRFQAHLEARERKMQYVSYLIIENIDDFDKYWDKNEYYERLKNTRPIHR